MKIKTVFIQLILFSLILSEKVLCINHEMTENEKVTLEEVGQFSDGGMAVTVLIVKNLAYVCDFDKGLKILDICDQIILKTHDSHSNLYPSS